MTPLLAIDVGNTNVTLGVWVGDRLSGPWRLATHRDRTTDEYAILVRGCLAPAGLDPGALEASVLCCVVPQVLDTITGMCRQFGHETLVVEPGVRTGMPILTEAPQDVGADRIVNAVAAHARHGGPILIVDLGTATTIDAVSARGEYLGGAIAPGVGVAAEALFNSAARLPRVEIRRPAQAIGRGTATALQSGLVLGSAALIDGLVRRMASELSPPAGQGVRVVATGGLAGVITAACETVEHVEPDLTLDGLRRIWERNRAPRPR